MSQNLDLGFGNFLCDKMSKKYQNIIKKKKKNNQSLIKENGTRFPPKGVEEYMLKF